MLITAYHREGVHEHGQYILLVFSGVVDWAISKLRESTDPATGKGSMVLQVAEIFEPFLSLAIHRHVG